MGKNNGYTLIEIITVIAIIAIIAGFIIPNVVGWVPRYRLRSGAEEIRSTLQLARLNAIKENKTAIVTFDTINNTFMATLSEQVIKSGKMPAGITIHSITSPSSEVQFDSRGLANESTGLILVKNNQGEIKTIGVNIVGKAKIY